MLDSFCFCVITLTTAGYVDLTSATMAGKVFTILYVFAGIGIISGFVYVVAKGAIRRRGGRDAPSHAQVRVQPAQEQVGSLQPLRCTGCWCPLFVLLHLVRPLVLPW
jgi:hypothetical protein